MLFKNKNKSQISMEYLIIIGIVLVIAITTSYFAFRPRQDAIKNEAEETVSIISKTVNDVTTLGPGNKIKMKLNIPEAIYEVTNENGQLNFKLFEDSPLYSDINYNSLLKTTGFFDEPIVPGVYDLIFESFGHSVCIYTSGDRNVLCTCLNDTKLLDQYTKISDVYCTNKYGSNEICDSQTLDLKYGDTITQFSTECVTDANNEVIDGYVIFKIKNWQDKIVYEGITYENENGNFILDDTFTIENSGNLNISATCYHECSSYKPETEELISSNSEIAKIPYGEIKPFLIDEYGNRIYITDVNDPLTHLINPDSSVEKNYMTNGQIKSGDVFVVRTGFECFGGECININASLWQSNGTNKIN